MSGIAGIIDLNLNKIERNNCEILINSSDVKVSTCPVSTGETLLTGCNLQKIIAHNLSRCLVRCWFVDFTSLLINESVAGSCAIVTMNLPDLVILATRRIQFKLHRTFGMTLCKVLCKFITQGQAVLNNLQFDVVSGVLSGAVVREGGSHWFVAYERIVRAYGCLSGHPCASYATVPSGISTTSGLLESSNECISKHFHWLFTVQM